VVVDKDGSRGTYESNTVAHLCYDKVRTKEL
jgi:hypothetical protein